MTAPPPLKVLLPEAFGVLTEMLPVYVPPLSQVNPPEDELDDDGFFELLLLLDEDDGFFELLLLLDEDDGFFEEDGLWVEFWDEP